LEAALVVLAMSSLITLKNINVKFLFRNPAIESLQGKLSHWLRVARPVSDKSREFDVHALKDINLQFDGGERIGLIGANGSGKSTLLKVLAGVLHPTSGCINVVGRVNAIFDPALGMDPEASGYENIRIRCMLMGVASRQISAISEQIADFSELGTALGRPIKSYSAGMSVRLAFSIATAIEPEILVMDEWLSAGDARFVSKAIHRLEDLVRSARMFVIASHSETILREWCTRLIWLENGRLVASGSPEKILEAYKAHISG
jgi:ABC-type polysaccharide/polyol phosphate transport system ATPase subunit